MHEDKESKFCVKCGEALPSPHAACPNCGRDPAACQTCQGPITLLSLVGEYPLAREVGHGAFGTVYESWHPRYRDPPRVGPPLRVAVKLWSPHAIRSEGDLQRFTDEAQLTWSLSHPGIVKIIDSGIERGGGQERPYLVMEFLDGPTLRNRLNEARLSFSETVSIYLQICDAVAAAHEQGCIHRDLKPDNVMLVKGKDDQPRVKVVDFGVAAIEGEGRKTQAGTEMYMAPETEVSPRLDVFSLGQILKEMLAGRRPWLNRPGETDLRLSEKCVDGVLPEGLDGPVLNAIEALIKDATALEAGQRIESVEKLSERLTALQAQNKAEPPPEGPIAYAHPVAAKPMNGSASIELPPSLERSRSHRMRWAVGGAVLLILFALAWEVRPKLVNTDLHGSVVTTMPVRPPVSLSRPDMTVPDPDMTVPALASPSDMMVFHSGKPETKSQTGSTGGGRPGKAPFRSIRKTQAPAAVGAAGRLVLPGSGVDRGQADKAGEPENNNEVGKIIRDLNDRLGPEH